jgi:hypothetical protein
MRCVPRTLLTLGVLLTVALCSSALTSPATALAASPWWHLSSGARPGNLQAGAAQDEVQEISAAAGSAFELTVNGTSVGLFESEPLPFGGSFTEATAANVQGALETVYGTGNVQVSGGPGGSLPLMVTTVNEQGSRPVAPVVVALALPGNSVRARVTTPGHADAEIVVTASNLGDAAANGSSATIQIADQIPQGLTPVSIEGLAGNRSVSQGPVTCSLATLTCSFESTLPPFVQIEVRIGVLVGAGATSGKLNQATVSGGGAPTASVRRAITVSSAPTPFGIEDYELSPEEEGGASDTQAGSHPFQLTTTFTLNQNAEEMPAALAKDTTFKWPAGLIGNPTAVPSCTLGQFLAFRGQEFVNACPQETAVGVAMLTINEPAGNLGTPGADEISTPIFNLEPAPGEPARFGFLAPGTPVLIDASVRTGQDYGITVKTNNISQTAAFLKAEVTVWGVPGDARHDSVRGNGCLRKDAENEELHPCHPLEEQRPSAFLTMPTSCSGTALQSTAQADSWQARGDFVSAPEAATLGTLDGCNRLPFAPSLKLSPDGQAASTPTGLSNDVHVPQEDSENPSGLAEGDVKDITVSLPEGLALNPAASDGLGSCTEAQIGFTGTGSEGTDHFNEAEPSCPDASKIAKATITTPVLPNPLTGYVYLASPQNFSAPPQENPFQSLVAMYLVARDPQSGVLVKLPGSVSLGESGQITASFNGTPQVPFEDAEIEFFGGDRAPLATPSHCGSYTTHASFTPWSGGQAATSSPSFNITSGPHGSPCPAALPFSPSLAAGTSNNNAAAFSPLTTTISREDGNQDIQSVELHMPPGLSGILAGVKLCPEGQANAGTCSQASEIGKTIVSVGLGGDPFTVTGGQVFLTEGYKGAPFGLSIVNPAVAGPFNLGKVIVRAKIEVDAHTTELTITTGAIPHILDGIPLQIKHVNVTIDRPGFTFNPTNCSPQSITGTIGSAEGASAPVSTPFQVTNCAALKFAPKFSVSTSGMTSKASGASLTATVSEPTGSMGTQANIGLVKVELPKQLPSRLTTLQKACLASVFNANPANCPSASVIGHAKVITPLLPVPLEGPAIFVSHGGEAFPSLTIVLQGYGVTVDLVGTTFIDKHGITSTTFKTVPDTPFNTFTLTLPEGKFSALAANGNLCTSKLVMPTEFIAQNGAKLKHSTPISTTGCGQEIAIAKKKLTGNSASVTVTTTVKGVVTITGSGLRKTSKALAAGSHALKVPLTAKGRAARKHRRKIKIKAALKVGKKTVSKTVSLKL